MAKRKKADEAEVNPHEGEGGPLDSGPRLQHTEEGEDVGTPVEEMPQVQRQEVGRLMAEEGKTFAEAVEQTTPKPAEPADDKSEETK